MGQLYANPPILEAVCEFRLPSDTQWDLTIPGLIYEQIRNDFPHKERRTVQEVELRQGPQGLQQQIRANERAVFLAEDRNTFVQVSQHFLSVNRLRPYQSWDAFKPSIERAFQSLIDTVDPRGLRRIGLLYVNRIEIPGLEVNLDDYFEFRPFLGHCLPQHMASFILGCVLPYSGERDSCRIELANAVPEREGASAFILTLDYFLAQPQAVQPAQALSWVDDAHQRIQGLFEGSISDRLRRLLNENE